MYIYWKGNKAHHKTFKKYEYKSGLYYQQQLGQTSRYAKN